MKVPRLPVGGFFEILVDFVRVTFALPFDWIKVILLWVNEQLVFLLELPPFWLVAIMVAIIAYFLAGEVLTFKAYLGALLMLIGVILVEVEFKSRPGKSTTFDRTAR